MSRLLPSEGGIARNQARAHLIGTVSQYSDVTEVMCLRWNAWTLVDRAGRA